MDYGFSLEGKVYTPNGTEGIKVSESDARNKAIEAAEFARWAERPDRMLAYYNEKTRTVTTWLGSTLGTIESFSIYRHNFGGRFIALSVIGTNGARYHGRASYDWGSCVYLHKSTRQSKGV